MARFDCPGALGHPARKTFGVGKDRSLTVAALIVRSLALTARNTTGVSVQRRELLAVTRVESDSEHQRGTENDHARTEHAERMSSAVNKLQYNSGNWNSGQGENKFGRHRSTPLRPFQDVGVESDTLILK